MKRGYSCTIGKVRLPNPVIAASGTFGYGDELASVVDINELGGFVTKTITVLPTCGNVPPRIYDLGFGIINSIGMENPGVAAFKKKYGTFLNSVRTPVFISMYGKRAAEWKKLIRAFDDVAIAGFELNLSCPNIHGDLFSADPKESGKLLRSLRSVTKRPLIAKVTYSPQIKNVAKALEKNGADAITAINTLPAVALEKQTRKPILGAVYGGLSGPCIKPVAMRAVYEVAREVTIPVIACGGVSSAQDVLDFLSLGAKAVQVGTANLVSPSACHTIIKDVKKAYGTKN